MPNGYVIAAEADLSAAHEVGEGFGLEVIGAGDAGDRDAVAAALAGAANVGVVLSAAAAEDDAFVALIRVLAQRLQTAQLIEAEAGVRARFDFLPQTWPAMTLEEARHRAKRRREGEHGGEPERAAPLPPSAPQRERDAPPADQAETSAPEAEAEPPPLAQAAPPAAPVPELLAKRSAPPAGAAAAPETAPADATAFAPKKLRRGTPELVRIVIHQPKQLRDVIRVARALDPRAAPAPQSMGVGSVALGAKVGVALDVRGGACDGAMQRRDWLGEPIDFSFSVEADDAAKQAVFLARVFIDDAQIGVLAFMRKIAGPAKKPASSGDVRLKRHKRVFLSYSSQDRETVSVIATAYQMAGVEHFWDRASLKSGEEWSPRLRREIERADLFHLCWSKAAARSEWVEKEASHALARRKRSGGKPEVTVQMLDGPPWAAHPASLDAINFDDFVRAAIVGYARGDGA